MKKIKTLFVIAVAFYIYLRIIGAPVKFIGEAVLEFSLNTFAFAVFLGLAALWACLIIIAAGQCAGLLMDEKDKK